MRFLLINHRYFISGGPERYLFNLKELLESHGHEVVPFSIKYEQNVPDKYDKYFVSPPARSHEAGFDEQTWNSRSLCKTLSRTFYSKEAYDKLTLLIKETKPDFAIILIYLRRLSPSIIASLRDNKVPFIVRISDFSMLCPNNGRLWRNNNICELCIRGSLFNSVRYKCVKGSYIASTVNYCATLYHRVIKIFETIPCFAIPSKFTLNKFIEAGYDPKRLIHLPTFVKAENPLSERKKQIVYIGRIEYDKGLQLLLESILVLKRQHGIDCKFLIIGFGNAEYIKALDGFIKTNRLSDVSITGKKEKGEVLAVLKESLFSVCPSLWYDNLPNSMLESLACGTPVIAPNHGSFVEIISNGYNGLLFNLNDVNDLALKMKILIESEELRTRMQHNSVLFIRENLSPEKHYDKLMEIYTLIKNTG